MFSFFKNKPKNQIQYPDFWQHYQELFNKENLPINKIRFVVFDTETTGFNYANDRILSIGAVDIYNNRIDLKKAFEIFLDQETFNPQAVSIHGIRKHHRYTKYKEDDAMRLFIEYIGNSVLVGHHIGFDVKMINAALERIGLPNLKNKTIDTNTLFKRTKIINPLLHNDKNYSLDDLCNELNIKMHDRHNAAGDSLLTALAFLKIKTKLLKDKKTPMLSHLS